MQLYKPMKYKFKYNENRRNFNGKETFTQLIIIMVSL